MKYCVHCGSELEDEAVVCIKCGCAQPKLKGAKTIVDESNVKERWPQVLSFFFPIVGLILFVMYLDERPKRAKRCGIWALVGFIIEIIIEVALISLYVLFILNYSNPGIIA